MAWDALSDHIPGEPLPEVDAANMIFSKSAKNLKNYYKQLHLASSVRENKAFNNAITRAPLPPQQGATQVSLQDAFKLAHKKQSQKRQLTPISSPSKGPSKEARHEEEQHSSPLEKVQKVVCNAIDSAKWLLGIQSSQPPTSSEKGLGAATSMPGASSLEGVATMSCGSGASKGVSGDTLPFMCASCLLLSNKAMHKTEHPKGGCPNKARTVEKQKAMVEAVRKMAALRMCKDRPSDFSGRMYLKYLQV